MCYQQQEKLQIRTLAFISQENRIVVSLDANFQNRQESDSFMVACLEERSSAVDMKLKPRPQR